MGSREWHEAVQSMIDWLEENLAESPTLLKLSEKVGYSPYYCSAQFHRIVGMTIKSYVAGRRLCRAALDIRDTGKRILDIAVEYGYSSQEALTRAFVAAFGCTPAAYRKNPRPLPLPVRQDVRHPRLYQQDKGGTVMSQFCLKEPEMRVEYIPAHKYMGVWDDRAMGYGDFWKYHDCDEVCGIVTSMGHVSDMVVTCHTAGWRFVDGKRRYFYGLGVPEDYSGEVPEGFSLKEFPGSYYLVFYHPPFAYPEDNGQVMKDVETLAWNYDIENLGLAGKRPGTAADKGKYRWNEKCQCYQRHYPEGLGYQVLRPFEQV